MRCFSHMTIRRMIEEGHTKNLEPTLLFVNFSEAFDSIHRIKLEQILLTKETVSAMMVRCKNAKVTVNSPKSDTKKKLLPDIKNIYRYDNKSQ